MIRSSFLILAGATALAFGGVLYLESIQSAMAGGALWGLGGGLVAALSALGGAAFAVRRNLAMNQALAIVVVGMLVRMLFMGAVTIAAIKLGGVDPVGFVIGFGVIFLVGQALEVRMLVGLHPGRSGPDPSQ